MQDPESPFASNSRTDIPVKRASRGGKKPTWDTNVEFNVKCRDCDVIEETRPYLHGNGLLVKCANVRIVRIVKKSCITVPPALPKTKDRCASVVEGVNVEDQKQVLRSLVQKFPNVVTSKCNPRLT